MGIRYVVVTEPGILSHTCSRGVADEIAAHDGGQVFATIPRELAEFANDPEHPERRLAAVEVEAYDFNEVIGIAADDIGPHDWIQGTQGSEDGGEVIFNEGIVDMKSITTVEQARAYAYFLQRERERHQHEVSVTGREASQRRSCGGCYHEAMAEFYDSAAYRHQLDVESTGKRIVDICANWGLPLEAD